MALIPFVPMDTDLAEYGDIISVEYFKQLTDNLNYLLDSVPVGEIRPIFVVSGLNEPDPRFWQECDGSAITNLTSPLRGYNTPDMKSSIATINSLTYRAKVPGLVTVKYLQYTPAVSAVKAFRILDDIYYEAQTAGAAGNAITIQVVADVGPGMTPGNLPVVSVVGTAITIHVVNLAYPGPAYSPLNTIAQVKTAVDGTPAAAALVATSLLTNHFANQVATTNLSGGVSSSPAIGLAGAEVVTVVGQDITVQLESGVSTIQGIKAKLELSAPAMALVSVSIPSGVGVTTQPAPVPTVPLTPGLYLKGAANLGIVGFASGQNTKNLQHSHNGVTQVFSAGDDGDTDNDQWSARAHAHAMSNDLNSLFNFEPAHRRIRHFIKIN